MSPRTEGLRAPGWAEGARSESGVACGKCALTDGLQRKRARAPAVPLPDGEAPASAPLDQGAASAAPSPPGDPFWFAGPVPSAVQRRVGAAGEGGSDSRVHQAAAQGLQDPAGPLPFLDVIQPLFGRHEVSQVQAHTGPAARAGAEAMGADAFATGAHVAFGRAPDLHTAAHEAAHVVQQQAGVSLSGGVGEVGDPYERNADRVADLVVAGHSAETVLDEHAGARGAPAPLQQRAVQRAGVERAGSGGPRADAPYVDAPVDGSPRGIGVTAGDVVQVRVTGNVHGSTLKARVTAGDQYVKVGASADVLGAECTIIGNTLFVQGVTSNEELAKSACEVTLLENEAELGKLQPKVYGGLDLGIHAWKVTLGAQAGDYAGIPVYGEELDMQAVISDVAATWRAAGIRINLAETTALHLQVQPNPDISVQVEQGLKADPRFDPSGRRVHLVFVPVYERFGLAMSRYSRPEVGPGQLVKDESRQRGFAAPVAVIGVNGFKKPDGTWGSRSKETLAMDQTARVTTAEDKAFHYQSVSSDTAHELGHLLSLPHVPSNPAPNLTNNATSSYLFSHLMHGQVAAPLRNLSADDQQNPGRLVAAQQALSNSAHPRTRLGEMRNSAESPSSYSTQRGALISDQFAQFARAHLRTGKVFSDEVEDEILEAELGLDDLDGLDEFDGGRDQPERVIALENEILRGTSYQHGTADLRSAITDILSDGGLKDTVERDRQRVLFAIGHPHDTIEALVVALAEALPPGKDRLAEELAGYLVENSGPGIQRVATGSVASGGAALAAARGVAGAGHELPFLQPIQRSFGRHDVSEISAHTDSAAAAGARALGATAFATGNHVAFAGAPDLHTAAHEAAHVVQQRRGVSLQRGLGEAGDVYERHADRVADAVVAGQSAEALLDAHAGSGADGGAVQRKPSDVAAFEVTKTAATPGAAAVELAGDPNVQALFAQVFPNGNIAQLPAVVGLNGIAALGDEALEETTVTARWAGGTARWEIEIRNPLFHLFLNEIRWAEDSGDPKPSLFLHKWDRNKDAGGGAGAGLAVFRSMHAAAIALGMTAIVADAIGDPLDAHATENGYYTWARFGFNGVLESDMGNFLGRLSALTERLAGLPAARTRRGELQAALPAECEAPTLGAEARAGRHLELRNRLVLEQHLDEPSQAELDYLTQDAEVAALEAEHATYSAPLAWFTDHCHEFSDLNGMFLAAPDAATRAQMATLWRGFGRTLTEANFDLAPGSSSNQVLANYVADVEAR